MKQVTYEFDWTHILPAIVSRYEIEDGFWRVELIMESMTGLINPVVEGQVQATLPGVQHRIAGFKLVKAEGFGSMTFYVEEGTISYGPDPDQRGHEEGGASFGGVSEYIAESVPTPIDSEC